jgi:hypothetical protein
MVAAVDPHLQSGAGIVASVISTSVDSSAQTALPPGRLVLAAMGTNVAHGNVSSKVCVFSEDGNVPDLSVLRQLPPPIVPVTEVNAVVPPSAVLHPLSAVWMVGPPADELGSLYGISDDEEEYGNCDRVMPPLFVKKPALCRLHAPWDRHIAGVSPTTGLPLAPLAAEAGPSSSDLVTLEGTDEERRILKALVQENSDVFKESILYSDLGDREIVVEMDNPDRVVVAPCNFVPVQKEKVVDDTISMLLEADLVGVACEADLNAGVWVEPIMVAPGDRMVWAGRKVNSATVSCGTFPSPPIDEILRELISPPNDRFCKLDLVKGFYQLKLALASRRFFGFRWRGVTYTFKVLPFGWIDSPALFNQRVQHLLCDSSPGGIKAYVDDLPLGSSSFGALVQSLTALFQRCRQHCFFLKGSKCILNAAALDLLGVNVSRGTIAPAQDKLDVISSFPLPSRAKQLKGYVGLLEWHHSMMPADYKQGCLWTESFM